MADGDGESGGEAGSGTPGPEGGAPGGVAEGAAGGPGPAPEPAPPPADWRSGIPEELKDSPSLANITDVADLASQFVNAQGLIGNSIRIPSENASDEDRAAFREKLLSSVPGLAEVASDDPAAFQATMRQLGAPEEATGYKLPDFEGENLTPVEGFNEWAHEASLTQAQFDTLARRFTEASVADAETKMAEHNAEMEALHRDWGYAYDQKVAAAVGAAKLTNAPGEFVEALEAGRVPASWVRYFATLSENYAESDIGGGDRQQQQAEMTPAEAQAQLNEIMGNRQHDYWRALPGTPEKQAAMALVMKLRHRAMGRQGREVVSELGQGELEG